MKIINASTEILTPITGDELQRIEYAGRTCYKSEDKITDDSAKRFVENLIKNGDEEVLKHSSLSVKFICDLGIGHELINLELVRHHLTSFIQASTKYCNCNKDKFEYNLTFIKPVFLKEGSDSYKYWENAMTDAEIYYFSMLDSGCTPQEARSVFPNSIKTEVVMTANYHEWRDFFWLKAARKSGPAHPQMEELTVPLLYEVSGLIPVVFDDIVEKCSEWRSQKNP